MPTAWYGRNPCTRREQTVWEKVTHPSWSAWQQRPETEMEANGMIIHNLDLQEAKDRSKPSCFFSKWNTLGSGCCDGFGDLLFNCFLGPYCTGVQSSILMCNSRHKSVTLDAIVCLQLQFCDQAAIVWEESQDLIVAANEWSQLHLYNLPFADGICWLLWAQGETHYKDLNRFTESWLVHWYQNCGKMFDK